MLPRAMFLASEREHRDDDQHDPVFFTRRGEVVAEDDDLLRGDHARRVVVLEPAELVQRPDDEELRCQGRNGEIEAADAQAGQAENDADQRGANARQQDRDNEGNAVDAQDQIVAGECAGRHEAGRAERKLAGIAHQDVLAERDQREDQPRNQDGAQPVVVGDEWE